MSFGDQGIICVLLSLEENLEFTTLGEKIRNFAEFKQFDPALYPEGTNSFLIYDNGVNVYGCNDFLTFKQKLTEMNENALVINQGYFCVLLYSNEYDLSEYMDISNKYSVCLLFDSKNAETFCLVLEKYNLNENSYLVFKDKVFVTFKTSKNEIINEINILFCDDQEKDLIGSDNGVISILMYTSGISQAYTNIEEKLNSYVLFKHKLKSNYPCVCDKYLIEEDCVLTYNSCFIKKDTIEDSYYTCLNQVVSQIERPLISGFQENKLLTILIYSNVIDPLWNKIKATWKSRSSFLEIKASDSNLLMDNYGLGGNPSFLFYKSGQVVYYGDISYVNCYYVLPTLS